MNMAYVITTDGGYWLSGLTKSRGSQAGIGRIWTPDLANALRWDTYSEAEVAYNKEGFDRFDCAFIAKVKP